MRAVAPGSPGAPGRWVWALLGVVTIAAIPIAAVTFFLDGRAGAPADSISAQPQSVVTRTVTIAQPVTSLEVQSYGAPVAVLTAPVRLVEVTETIAYDARDSRPPAVTYATTGGRLTLAAPACAVSGCSVGFTVTVPAPGHAAVTVASDGGPVTLDGLSGPLRADTDGGSLTAQDLAATTVAVTTDGGSARLKFTAAPQTVLVSTDGGPVVLTVPGGPYALTADTDGGPLAVAVATDSAAPRSITVVTGGGPLLIGPSTLRTATGGTLPLPPVSQLRSRPPPRPHAAAAARW